MAALDCCYMEEEKGWAPLTALGSLRVWRRVLENGIGNPVHACGLVQLIASATQESTVLFSDTR